MSNKVRTVSNEAFEQDVLQSTTPVLVDFYADWCGPCKAVGPVVEQLGDDYEGRLNVRKVDIDSDPELASRCGVRSIPTLILFKDGVVQDTVIGAVPRSKLVEVINQYVV